MNRSRNLTTIQAIEWLASQGVCTSPDGLRRARLSGRLKWLKVTGGRARILYKADDLTAAFIQEVSTCPSVSSDDPEQRTGISGAVLPETVFSKALAQATKKRRKT